MKKTYQTNAASAATDELVMPETVTLAMADLAETVKEACWPSPSAPASASCR